MAFDHRLRAPESKVQALERSSATGTQFPTLSSRPSLLNSSDRIRKDGTMLSHSLSSLHEDLHRTSSSPPWRSKPIIQYHV